MLLFWPGRGYPFEVQPGDILFIAGCQLPVNRGQKLLFEHVAIAAEHALVRAPEDMLDLSIYGMPESGVAATDAGNLAGISLNTGRYWAGRDWLGDQLGASQTVWNLGCRADSVDGIQAKEIAFNLAQRAGSFLCRYSPLFRVDGTLATELQTNCLGFVCSVLEYFDLALIAHDFPEYRSPYADGRDTRDFPSPGHLAHVLDSTCSITVPWRATNSDEAERYARADATLEQVVGRLQGSIGEPTTDKE